MLASAPWIPSPGVQLIAPDPGLDSAPLLRREVTPDPGHGTVTRAVLQVTACGIVEPYLGTARCGDDVLSPGWSSFEWRLRYRSYDVTERFLPAAAPEGATGLPTLVLGLALGNGWYLGRLGWNGRRNFYGDEPAAVAELELTFQDGHVQRVGTDTGWQAGPSAVLADDLYDGQTIDARRADQAWLQPGAQLPGWVGVHAVPFDPARLTPYLGPPVRRQELLRPLRVWATPAGHHLVDFGQNLVGWVRCRATGPAGSTITVRHAEVLQDGELATRPLRSAQATDRFVLSGDPDRFEPTMTFHGFRFAQVQGWPGELTPDDLDAVVVHSDLRRIGTFECSEPLLNQLHSNVVWSLRGNAVSVPTDCPQRDERMGWTGDLAVFAPAAAYLYDVSGFLDDWLADLACEQRAAGGSVPFVVPNPLKYEESRPFGSTESTAIWADAAVWVPAALWQAYGDMSALARHYPAMAAHARHVLTLRSPNGLWDTGFQFGDWLDPTAPPDAPLAAKADPAVVATACLYRTLDLVAAAAGTLGHDDDAATFSSGRDLVRAAFLQHYLDPGAIVRSDCPTVYALAITFGLLDGAVRERAGARLAELVRQNGFRISTGFAGTPYLLDALSRTGQLDTAYRLLLQRECPSWLFPVTMGATTIWERWDSLLPDGSINPGSMTSFNHYALGAVADWMHRIIGGIAPLRPGYSEVLVAPQPGGGISWARAALQTPHGRLASNWAASAGGGLTLELEIPDGVTAAVRLPGTEPVRVGAGRHRLTGPVPPHAESAS